MTHPQAQGDDEMNDAPERIWLLPFDGEQRCWCDDPDPSGLGHDDDATGYVRADLVDALRKALTGEPS